MHVQRLINSNLINYIFVKFTKYFTTTKKYIRSLYHRLGKWRYNKNYNKKLFRNDKHTKLIEIKQNKLIKINPIVKLNKEKQEKKIIFNFKDYLNYNEINNEPKKYIAANKEWNNSIYTYNKSTITNSLAKDNMVTKIIKNYFSLSTYKLRKSKRMSDLIKRSTTKQLFVSNIEIKQNSDKAIITGYIYDRHRKYLTKKTYLFMKNLENSRFDKKKLNKSRNFNSLHFNKSYMDFSLFKKRSKKYLNSAINFYKNKQFSDLIKFYFLTWALSIFDIRIKLSDKLIKIERVNSSNNIENITISKLMNEYNSEVIRINNHKSKKYNDLTNRGKKRFNKKRYTLKKFFDERNKANSIWLNNKLSYYNLSTINIKLLKILNLVLKKQEINLSKRNLKINELFTYFFITYIKDFSVLMIQLFKYNYLTIRKLLKKWIFSKKKLSTFLPYIKTLISKIYEKKIEFNIVNLKYIYLDGDIFLKAISIKLKKKKSSLSKVLRKSMGLIKIDKNYKDDYRNNYQMMYFNQEEMIKNFNKILISYGGRNIYNMQTNKKILLKKYFNYLFNDSTNISLNENIFEDKIISIIKKLKFKKITGIKLEASGRLTKRFTASRALHKIRVKGSLINFDHLKEKYRGLQKPSVQTLRGIQKPNLQYSFVKSRKRMGAFGIKSWLSSN